MTSERRAQTFHTDDASLPTKIWVVLLIGWSKFPSWHDQSEVLPYLPRSVKWRVISMEFLRSFLRRHFAGKPFVASRKVGSFLRLICSQIGFFQHGVNPWFWPKIWQGFIVHFLAKKASQKCFLKRQETRNHIDFSVNRTLFYRTSYFQRQIRIKCNYELHMRLDRLGVAPWNCIVGLF